MSQNSEVDSGRKRNSKLLIFVMGLIVVGLLAACGYLFFEYQKAVAKQPKTDAQKIADISQRVGDAVVLPDEKPTIATVADKTKLSEPQLATQAKNGDEILVYSKAKRVILYRPSLHKVVDMFRVDVPAATSTKTQ